MTFLRKLDAVLAEAIMPQVRDALLLKVKELIGDVLPPGATIERSRPEGGVFAVITLPGRETGVMRVISLSISGNQITMHVGGRDRKAGGPWSNWSAVKEGLLQQLKEHELDIAKAAEVLQRDRREQQAAFEFWKSLFDDIWRKSEVAGYKLSGDEFQLNPGTALVTRSYRYYFMDEYVTGTVSINSGSNTTTISLGTNRAVLGEDDNHVLVGLHLLPKDRGKIVATGDRPPADIPWLKFNNAAWLLQRIGPERYAWLQLKARHAIVTVLGGDEPELPQIPELRSSALQKLEASCGAKINPYSMSCAISTDYGSVMLYLLGIKPHDADIRSMTVQWYWQDRGSVGGRVVVPAELIGQPGSIAELVHQEIDRRFAGG